MRWIALLLLAGCLDYEVTIETTVAEDGSFERTVAIRETSKKPTTWVRYAPPAAPYVLGGSEKEGFLAMLKGGPGSHAGGLRVVLDDPEGDYNGAETVKHARFVEGEVRVRVDDVVFGKLYRYEERIDIGIDLAKFRKELDFLLETGLSIMVAACELMEPEVDFGPLREHVRKNVFPELRGSIYLVHAELARLIARWNIGSANVRIEDLDWDRSVALLLAEFERFGVRRKGPAPTTAGELFDASNWTINDRMWGRLLEPLEKMSADQKKSLREKWRAEIHGEGEGKWLVRAYEQAVPEENREALDKRVQAWGGSAVGVLSMHEFFDEHLFRVRVRMPGTLLMAEGAQLHRHPVAEWHFDDLLLANPRCLAWSFVPNEKMVGRILDARALIRFADEWRAAPPEDRAEIEEFLKLAKKEGLAAAFKKQSDTSDPWLMLRRVLAEK